MTNTISRPVGSLIDFRDEHGTSTVDCGVCGSPADGWDTRNGLIFHSSVSAFIARKEPCRLGVGL